MSHVPDFTGLEQLADDVIDEHVGEVMFDPGASPEPDCLLCKAGVGSGAWKRYGVDDPFAPPGDDE